MFRTLAITAVTAVLAVAASTAHADPICYPVQVCEEVCTPIVLQPIEGGIDLTLEAVTTARLPRTRLDPPMHCETACDLEEFCYPEGGGGGDYDTDDIDACYAQQLLVDQIRCIQMLGL